LQQPFAAMPEGLVGGQPRLKALSDEEDPGKRCPGIAPEYLGKRGEYDGELFECRH